MITRLSCDEIYSRVVRSKDPQTEQTVYLYYLVPFKEKVFFWPQRGFTEAFDSGELSEISIRPDFIIKDKYILISFITYTGRIETRERRKNLLRK